MVTTDELRQRLAADRLVAIVRGSDPDACVAAVGVLADAGIDLVEVSLTTTDALSVLERVVAAHPRMLIGAGTVLTAEQAQAVRDVGVSYVVTPANGPGVTAAAELGLPVLAGCLTPTEVLAAHQAGHLVKLFPAGPFGLPYFKALRDPFPGIPLIPVGGVDAALATDYLAAGALAVGVGSPLLGDAPHGGDLAGLASRARSFRAAVSTA
jgi:2-dehydro-3-deoxyphosphogluconate aldolase / (4S)-4-hydroxy-2-oxoglutarate aldolase